MTPQVFYGCDIFDGTRIHAHAALVVEGGRVADVVPASHILEPGALTRLEGGLLAPGFLDLQVNGGGGIMLNDAPTLDGIRRICATHAALGVTALLPTLITDTPEVTRAVLAAGIAAAAARVPGFLGLHLEGPHLDPRRSGAHDPRLIRPMTDADLAAMLDAAPRLPVLMVTLAPEAATAAQIAALAAAGVHVSLGHSDCSLATARAAFAAGARLVTHLFNAMSPLTHREPGLAGAALDTGPVHAGLIADGIHVAPEVLRIALAAKRPPGGLFLVSDAMAVAGTGLAEFTLGGRRILRRDGRLTLADGTLAGADIDMGGALRVLTGPVGLAPEAALALATAAPAAAVGQAGDRGRLAPGARADLVHLDATFHPQAVWYGGRRG